MSMTLRGNTWGCAVIAAASLLTAAQAHAQQDPADLSAEAVEGFFEKMEQDAVRMVKSGDFQGLVGWAAESIAEEATFFVSENVYAGDRYKGSAVLSMNKQDVLALSNAAMGMMSELPEGAVQDYALEIEVTDIVPIGPNAATASTRIVERGSFLLSGGSPAGSAESGDTAAAADASAAPVELEATTECRHLVRRAEAGDRLLLGMTSCHAEIRF